MKGKLSELTVEDVPKIWKWALIYMVLYAIIRIGFYFIAQADIMLENVLVNIGCTIAVSIVLNVFIYYRHLKRIPEDTHKAINNLLDARLGYETSNHNAVLNALNPDNRHLSTEHEKIREKIETANSFLSVRDAEEKLRSELLSKNQKLIEDSVKNLASISDEMKKVNHANIELKAEIVAWKEKCEALSTRKYPKESYSSMNEYELEI